MVGLFKFTWIGSGAALRRSSQLSELSATIACGAGALAREVIPGRRHAEVLQRRSISRAVLTLLIPATPGHSLWSSVGGGCQAAKIGSQRLQIRFEGIMRTAHNKASEFSRRRRWPRHKLD